MKRRIVLVGPPASGKGTQAELIQAAYSVPVTSPGAIFREEKQKGTPLGLRADELTSRGALLPDEMVVDVVKVWLAENNGAFLFDGFPRTVGQAEALAALLEQRDTPLEAVLLLEADIDTLRRRVQQRLVCQQCGGIVSEGLHVTNASDQCPKCGGTLSRRADDTLETLERRMEQYSAKTMALVGYYESRGLLYRIDSTRAPEAVFKSIAAVLEAP